MISEISIAEATVSYYDKRWDVESQGDSPPNPERVQLVTALTAKHCVSLTNPRILEVGCGNGWILQSVATALSCPHTLFGIEPSAIGAENARARVPKATIDCGFFTADSFRELFDVVICSEVLEHVPDQATFVKNLAGVVSPNGLLVLTTPNGKYRDGYFEEIPWVAQPLEEWVTASELRQLLTSSFGTVRLSSFDSSHWLQSQPGWARFRERFVELRGGWRTLQWIEPRLLQYSLRGLYLLATAGSPLAR